MTAASHLTVFDYKGHKVHIETTDPDADGVRKLKVSTTSAETDGVEALLTTLNTYTDGLETLIAATNALVTTQAGYLDGLEALITSSNTKLDSLHTDLATTLAAYVDGLEGVLGTTAGAGVITDANGTVQQYLRGLVAQWVANTLTLASAAHAASVTFTPAATSHVANDCNGAAGQFASMGLSGKPVMITSASLLINSATAEASAWRLYLYNVTPPSATADDGAWDLPSGDQASFLGIVDLGTAVDLGSTQWVETNGINKQIKLSGTGVFAYLVNLTTLTPAAVAHTVTLHTVEL